MITIHASTGKRDAEGYLLFADKKATPTQKAKKMLQYEFDNLFIRMSESYIDVDQEMTEKEKEAVRIQMDKLLHRLYKKLL